MKNNKPLMQKYFQPFLIGLCIILSYLIWEETRPLQTVQDAQAAVNETDAAATLVFPSVANTMPEIEEFDEMINRPLFFENRQPFVFEEAPEPATPKKKKANTRKTKEQYALNAVIITPKTQIAIIQSGRGKELQRIPLGEAIDGWILESIEPRSVLLKKGSETKNLELEIKPSKTQKKTASKKTTNTAKSTQQKGKTAENTEKTNNNAENINAKSASK